MEDLYSSVSGSIANVISLAAHFAVGASKSIITIRSW